MKSKLIVLSAALMLVLAGCNNKQSEFVPASSSDSQQTSSSSDDTTVHVQSVSVSPATLSMYVGQESTLTATVLPENATNKDVTWTSSDASVTVDDGVLTAVSVGGATITATTADGGKTATCQVTVTAKPPKPAGAVDLQYGYAEVMDEHGNDYCYFDNHEHWDTASYATVNEAYIYEGTIVYDYTVGADVAPSAQEWGIQLIRENTELVTDKFYELTFTMNSNKAGTIIVNDQEKAVAVGNNNISVTYQETQLNHNENDRTSFRIQFPHGRFGSARVEISNVAWEEVLSAPEGVVVNESPLGSGNYIIAFAAVAGATGYKAYYVNSSTSEDVDNEQVTNGGALTKVASLPDGKYKVYVTTLKGTKESPRSTSFGQITKGEVAPVVPAGGPKTNMSFGEEHKDGVLALPDDRFVYWNDQGWCGSVIEVDEAYTEEGTVNATYRVTAEYEAWNQGYEGCNYCFQIFYKNTSLTAGAQYTLSYTLNSQKAGTVTANGQAQVLEAGVNKTVSVDYTENANDASFALVFPSSMGNNTIAISNLSWVAK